MCFISEFAIELKVLFTAATGAVVTTETELAGFAEESVLPAGANEPKAKLEGTLESVDVNGAANEKGVIDAAVVVAGAAIDGTAANDFEGLDWMLPNILVVSLPPKVSLGSELGTTELAKLPKRDFAFPATSAVEVVLVLESVC